MTARTLSKRTVAVLNEPMMRSAAPLLSEKHEAMLRASAIAPDVAAARGYRTIRHGDELTRFHFGPWAHRYAPGLLVPYQDALGNLFAEIRPDKTPEDGRKYIGWSKNDVGPGGRTHGLNVPPTMREKVLHSLCPLWITEGSKKVDSLVSLGICAVGVTGVWKFLHETEDGGRKEFLPDFDIIPLKGREVVFCFDSDAMTKSGVYAALKRFSKGLKKRGAKVSYCYLPDDGEQKVGADDFIAAGHTAEDLHALVREELEPIANEPVTALINALNKKCRGKATFRLNRCDVAGDNSKETSLSIISDILPHKAAIDGTVKLWIGDACRAANLPHGSKGDTLQALFGPYAAQVGKWETIAKRFSGPRDYFRDAAPFPFLEETYQSKLTDEQQDELLTDYLTADEPMRRDELRARVKQMTEPETAQEDASSSQAEPSAPGLPTDSLIGFIFGLMPEEARSEMEALLREYDPSDVVTAARDLLKASFAGLPHLIRERLKETSFSFYSNIGENLPAETDEEDAESAFKFCAAQNLPSQNSENSAVSPQIVAAISNPEYRRGVVPPAFVTGVQAAPPVPPAPPNLVLNGQVVECVQKGVLEAKHLLPTLPGLVVAMIRDDLWKDRICPKTGERATFTRFEQFVTAPPLQGLGATMEMLKRICREDAEALDLIDQAVQNPNGGDRRSESFKVLNTNVETETEKPEEESDTNWCHAIREGPQEDSPVGRVLQAAQAGKLRREANVGAKRTLHSDLGESILRAYRKLQTASDAWGQNFYLSELLELSAAAEVYLPTAGGPT